MSTLPIIALVLAGAAPQTGTHPLADVERVSDEDLAAQRGGFRLGDLDLKFGAEIRTYLQGELVLQTNVSWDQIGQSQTTFVSPTLTRAAQSDLEGAVLDGAGIRMTLGDQTVLLANAGQTALIHRADGAIQNVLINTANGVVARQEIEATLDVRNAVDFGSQIAGLRLGDSLNSAINDRAVANISF